MHASGDKLEECNAKGLLRNRIASSILKDNTFRHYRTPVTNFASGRTAIQFASAHQHASERLISTASIVTWNLPSFVLVSFTRVVVFFEWCRMIVHSHQPSCSWCQSSEDRETFSSACVLSSSWGAGCTGAWCFRHDVVPLLIEEALFDYSLADQRYATRKVFDK